MLFFNREYLGNMTFVVVVLFIVVYVVVVVVVTACVAF